MKSSYLLVSGESLDIILKNTELKCIFLFIVQLIDKFISFGLSAINKKQLVQLVQNDFIGNPSVLSLGDGYNDTLMMQESAVSVQKVNLKDGKTLCLLNGADFLISDLEQLSSLLKVEGRHAFDMFIQGINTQYIICYVLGFIQFFFNWYCSFSGGVIVDSRMIAAAQIFASLVLMMNMLKRDKNKDALNDKHPILYS